MTASAFIVFDKAIGNMGEGEFDFATHDFYGVLSTAAQALPASFVGASTNCQYSDLTDELVGAGYTAGGELLTGVSWTDVGGGKWKFTFDSPTWIGLTGTFKYFSVYDTDNANNCLVGRVDLDLSGGGSIAVSATDYTVNVPGDGAFDIEQI